MSGRTRVTLTGGQRMQKELKRIAESADANLVLRVGFLEGRTYPDKNSTPFAQVAFLNEFGTSTIPSRPFFRTMIEKRSPKWGAVLGANLEANGFNYPNALARLGLVIKDQLTQSIIEWSEPPNAQSTIDRKGFNDPLVHTGALSQDGATGFEIKSE